MRIDNNSNLGYDRNIKPVKSTSNAATLPSTGVSQTASPQASGGQSRSDRIASLKQQFASGKPIDVQKLASTLVQSGVFFDENA